jgi:zinc protease
MIRRAMLLAALLPALLLAAAGGPDAASWPLGLEPRLFTLDNGLTVILQRDEAAPTTVVQLLVRSGDRDDPPGLPGLAYLTGRLCLEVTDQAKLQQLVDLGSTFSLAVGGDYSLITFRSLSRHLDPTLAVLAAMVAEPLISDLRVDGIKELMRFLQKLEADDPVSLMRRTVASSFYGEPAYGAARFGDEASLARIGRKDIQAFYRAHYAAGNMVAVVISDLDEEELRPLLARRLGRFAPGGRPPLRPLPLRRPAAAAVDLERKTAQTLVSISLPLPPLTADNLAAASLLETWLGKGIGSRMWSLRSRAGLAYGLTAEVQPNRAAMLLSVYVLTDARRRVEAQAELSGLLREVAANGVGAAELEAAKAYARADLKRDNETRERRAAYLAFLEGNGLSWRLAGELSERLQRIGLEEFNGLLRTWLAPENWFFVQVGPPVEEKNSSTK